MSASSTMTKSLKINSFTNSQTLRIVASCQFTGSKRNSTVIRTLSQGGSMKGTVTVASIAAEMLARIKAIKNMITIINQASDHV